MQHRPGVGPHAIDGAVQVDLDRGPSRPAPAVARHFARDDAVGLERVQPRPAGADQEAAGVQAQADVPRRAPGEAARDDRPPGRGERPAGIVLGIGGATRAARHVSPAG